MGCWFWSRRMLPRSGIEPELHAIGEERIFAQAVGPRRQKRNAAELGLSLQLGQGCIRQPERILAVDLELVRQVAEGGRDGHLGVARGVGQQHHFDAVHDGFLRGIIGGDGHKRKKQRSKQAHLFDHLSIYRSFIDRGPDRVNRAAFPSGSTSTVRACRCGWSRRRTST